MSIELLLIFRYIDPFFSLLIFIFRGLYFTLLIFATFLILSHQKKVILTLCFNFVSQLSQAQLIKSWNDLTMTYKLKKCFLLFLKYTLLIAH